jgi:hypothetical protein
MRAAQQQIVISRQVWVCDTCGCRDNKSCGCDSVAHAEEIAAKKEANRQAARRSYEKAKQNQHASHNETNVENVEESDERPEALPTRVLVSDGGRLPKSDDKGLVLTVLRAALEAAERDCDLGLVTLEQIKSVPRRGRFVVEERSARRTNHPIKHDDRVLSPALGERVGRLANRLVRLDVDLARELVDLILQRGVAERLWADLGTGIEIEGSDADDPERSL